MPLAHASARSRRAPARRRVDLQPWTPSRSATAPCSSTPRPTAANGSPTRCTGSTRPTRSTRPAVAAALLRAGRLPSPISSWCSARPTSCPPSLVWELAYAELVFVPTAWRDLGGPTSSTRSPTSAAATAASAGSTTNDGAAMSELYRDTASCCAPTSWASPTASSCCSPSDHGKVRAVAKGVRKTMSKFGARLEPMSHVKLLLYQRPRARHRQPGRVGRVARADASSTSTAPRRAWPRSRPSTRCRSTANRTRASTAWLVGVLRTIAERAVAAGRAGVLLEAARGRGCRARARRVRALRRANPTPLVAFDLDEGGVLCRSCRTGAPISPDALEVMRDDPRRSPERRARAARRVAGHPRGRRRSPRGRSSTTSSAACARSRCSRRH